MTKREEQAAISRQKLIDATRILISQKDYEHLSIKDITNACGMSPGNFYHYFKSKEDIFLAIEHGPLDQLLLDLKKSADDPVEEQVIHYLTGYVRACTKDYGVNLNRQWFRYHVMDPVADPPRPNKMEITRNEIKNILDYGLKHGQLKEDTPIDTFTLYFSCLLHGISLYSVMANENINYQLWIHSLKKSVHALLAPYLIP